MRTKQQTTERLATHLEQRGYTDPIGKARTLIPIIRSQNGEITDNGNIMKQDLTDFEFSGENIFSVQDLARRVFGSPGNIQASAPGQSAPSNSDPDIAERTARMREQELAKHPDYHPKKGETEDMRALRLARLEAAITEKEKGGNWITK